MKADFTARRAKANRVLRLDVFDLRHRIPRAWYVGAYTRMLPWPTRSWPAGDRAAWTGITADDCFVTDQVDDTTLVLFRHGVPPPARRLNGGRACWRSG